MSFELMFHACVINIMMSFVCCVADMHECTRESTWPCACDSHVCQLCMYSIIHVACLRFGRRWKADLRFL